MPVGCGCLCGGCVRLAVLLARERGVMALVVAAEAAPVGEQHASAAVSVRMWWIVVHHQGLLGGLEDFWGFFWQFSNFFFIREIN